MVDAQAADRGGLRPRSRLTPPVEAFDGPRAELGEGPYYDASSGEVWWVDLYLHRLHATSLATGTTRTTQLARRAAFVLPGRTPSERLLGTTDGLVYLEHGQLGDAFVRVDDADEDTCLNDGKADALGRVWAGTLSLSRAPWKCAFYRIDVDGRVDEVFSGVGLSNGLGWSPDGATFYYTDSHTQTISAYDFDLAAGTLSGGRALVHVPAEAGMPDGLAVDAEGGVWVALYQGSAVHRYDPSGKLDEVLTLPATYPTSVAFGGSAGRTLFVTTAMALLAEDERAAESAAGRLLAVDLDVAGAPVHVPAIAGPTR